MGISVIICLMILSLVFVLNAEGVTESAKTSIIVCSILVCIWLLFKIL